MTTTFTLTDATGSYDWMLGAFPEAATRQDVIDFVANRARDQRDDFQEAVEARAAQLRYPTFDGIEDEDEYIAYKRDQMIEDMEIEMDAARDFLLAKLAERGLLIEDPEPDGQGGGAVDTTSYENAGYAFGKAMTARNMDPMCYANQIMAYGRTEHWRHGDGEEYKAVLRGCERAVSEVPASQLAANTVQDFMAKVLHDVETMGTQAAEVEAFHAGVDSVLTLLYATRPFRGGGAQMVNAGDQTQIIDDNYARGEAVGREIISMWLAALEPDGQGGGALDLDADMMFTVGEYTHVASEDIEAQEWTLSHHKGEMPAHLVERFDSIDALTAAMQKYAPLGAWVERSYDD